MRDMNDEERVEVQEMQQKIEEINSRFEVYLLDWQKIGLFEIEIES